jgi:hypothetical protein
VGYFEHVREFSILARSNVAPGLSSLGKRP